IRHEAICRALRLLTPAAIRAIRERLGPSQEQFAQLTGIGKATISRWECGRLLQNRALDNYLRLLAHSGEAVRFLEHLHDPEQEAERPPKPESSSLRPRFPRLRDPSASLVRARCFQVVVEAN